MTPRRDADSILTPVKVERSSDAKPTERASLKDQKTPRPVWKPSTRISKDTGFAVDTPIWVSKS